MEGDVGVFAVWERAMHLIQDLLFVFHNHLKPLLSENDYSVQLELLHQ